MSDFQDWPPWPPLVVATATELARYTRQHLIAAQTALARITQAPGAMIPGAASACESPRLQHVGASHANAAADRAVMRDHRRSPFLG